MMSTSFLKAMYDQLGNRIALNWPSNKLNIDLFDLIGYELQQRGMQND